MRFRNVEFYGFGGGLDVSEAHFAPFALSALLCVESLDVDTPNVQRTIYRGGVHLQKVQQKRVNHVEKCRCSRMGRHYGNMEDGGCQTSKIGQVATVAGVKPAAGKGQGAYAIITSTDRTRAGVRGAWRA